MADMEHYLIPIIRKKSSHITLHVETNDPKNLPLGKTIGNMLKLKVLMKDSLPTCREFLYLLSYALMVVKHK